MPDPQQYDLSTAAKDPGFLSAPVPRKIAFLSAHDPDFAKAPLDRQMGYVNHILGNDALDKDAMQPNERQANEFLLGAASGSSGLPETMNPVGDAMKAKPDWKGIAADSILGPGAGIARSLYGAASQIFSPQKPNESPDDAAERRAHGIGSVVGQAVPAMAGEAAERGAGAFDSVRSTVAQKAVAPLVDKPLGATEADLKFGRNPAQAITDEGLVGSKKAMVQQAKRRLSQLSSAAEKQLSNHPNANTITDVEPIIDGAIDSAQSGARKLGQKATIGRLEDLREALKTEYGPLQGTPLDIHQLKQTIGDAASDLGAFKHTDPLESSAASAMSDIYSRLNDVVKSQVPEVGPINDRMANLISAKTGLNRNIAAETNKPLFEGSLSTLPFRIANKTVTSAPVRSGVARMLNMGNTLDVPNSRYFSPPARTPVNTPFDPRGLLGEGATALPYPDTSGPVPMSERTPPMVFNNLRNGPPPAFDPRFSVEPTGRMANPDLLGPRGMGGMRVPPRGLLPAPPAPIRSTPYAPPAPRTETSFNPFAGMPERAPELTQLKDYTPDEIENAELLVRQTIDMMQSGDRPGRYYSENEIGDYNPQRTQSASKGVTSGGHWYGVKSMRTMLPWIKDAPFTPSQLEYALKRPDSIVYDRVMKSAARFVREEAKNRQPGDELP